MKSEKRDYVFTVWNTQEKTWMIRDLAIRKKTNRLRSSWFKYNKMFGVRDLI